MVIAEPRSLQAGQAPERLRTLVARVGDLLDGGVDSGAVSFCLTFSTRAGMTKRLE